MYRHLPVGLHVMTYLLVSVKAIGHVYCVYTIFCDIVLTEMFPNKGVEG